MMNCYECRFALEARNLPRQGEQVRCAKAEELFGTNLKGGQRWVDVRRSERTGKLLKAKCGTFEPFSGDDSRAPDPEKPARKVKKMCKVCKGSGTQAVAFIGGFEHMKCHSCDGKGKVEL
jgi:hypothetical protein